MADAHITDEETSILCDVLEGWFVLRVSACDDSHVVGL